MTLVCAVFLAIGLLAFYAVAIEPMRRPAVRRYSLAPDAWRDGPALTIAVVSDIHAGPPHMSLARVERIVTQVNALGADMIILLGDYAATHRFQSRRYAADEWAAPLAGLAAPLGVFGVLGNHDWWDDAAAQARGDGPTQASQALTSVGIRVLENEARKLTANGRAFWLAGLASQGALVKRRPRRPFGRCDLHGLDDLPATLAQVTDQSPVLLLAHEPDIFADATARIALTLAGHTHGGQVSLFGWRPVVPSRFGARYAYGHIRQDARHLVVSGGLGCSGAPIRFGVRPEIVLVELNAPVDMA